MPDPRNRKVELQKKMELSVGTMLYTGYFLNHLQPTNDHEIGWFLSIMFSSDDQSLQSMQCVQEINSFHLVKK